MERKKYPIRAEDYELYETVGQGVSASVYRARCIPLEEVVAIKILDFERNNSDLNNISREAQTMILIDHPNVLKAYCSFVNDHNLWVVMPYMAGGSCLHIMKSAYPNGFEEVVIATVLKEVLKGLEYLHHHGHIHRDIKAGNILVDSRGGIKLGDYGVSACLFESGDRQRTRNTFVGTPCWMAPEVMEQLNGYNFKADIWSFGITALELAHGHAPFSKYPPMKVLLMTLQNAPPSLDYDRDRKFSRSFRQVVSMCLVKDPSKRPTAQKLLKQPFFKQARSQDYMVRKILDGLPSLGVRHQALKDKEEDLLAQKKMPDAKKEEISQNEYKRGISGWNFDIEDLKAQASLISENEDNKDSESCRNSLFEISALHERTTEGIPMPSNDDDLENTSPHTSAIISPDPALCQHRIKNDASDNEIKASVTSDQNALQNGSPFHHNEIGNGSREISEADGEEKHLNNVVIHSIHDQRPSASSSSPSEFLQSSKGESSKTQFQQQNMGDSNEGGIQAVVDINNEAVSKPSKPAGDDVDDKSKPPLVQQKGRFKVTSESVDLDKGLPPIGLQKSHSMQVISQLPSPSMTSPSDITPNGLGGSLLPQLHAILQANVVQRDNILSMMRQLSTGDPDPNSSSANRASDISSLFQPNIATEKTLLEFAHEREKELIQEVGELQWRLVCLQEELQRVKSRNAQV